MDRVRAWLETTPLSIAAAVFLAQNILTFFLALGVGALFLRAFPSRRVAEPPAPIDRTEITLAAVAVVLNTAVTFAGLLLWRHGYIVFRDDTGARALLDVIVLLVVMDALMYGLHRVAHLPPFFAPVHSIHHRYERVRPLTLFVLSPLEVAGFGGLWLVVLCVYEASWLGMSLYLVLNTAFGVIGHLGVEPLPARVLALPGFRFMAMAGFHARHHCDPDHNYGFYTVFWDRLFRTLAVNAGAGAGQRPHALDLPAVDPAEVAPPRANDA